MRFRRAVLPAVLAVGALAGGTVAAVGEAGAAADGSPVGGPTLTTPVLSARRVPSVVAAPIADRRLRADLAEWASLVPEPACALVVDPGGEVVLDHRAAEALVPASTAKLLTAAAALEVLGPEHRFRTVVRGPAPVDGVVPGDLHLVGGGDPVLSTPEYLTRYRRQPQVHTDLTALVDAIESAGVRRVEGRVVGDEGRYDQARWVDGWPPRYVEQHQTGPLSALLVNDGLTQWPTPERWRELVAAPEPAVHAAAELVRLLEARGIEVVGDAAAGPAPAEAPELAAVESPPLAEVVRQLLQESDNTTAELLVKELGAAVGEPTTVGGLAVVRAALEQLGLDLAGVDLRDGSGLSIDSRVSCRVLVEVLRHPTVGPLLRERLAVAGRSGTLAEAFVDTSLEEALEAKTGSLRMVRSLAGFVTDDDGAFTFAFIANDDERDGWLDEGPVRLAQASLGQILLSWPQIPDLEALGPTPPPGG